MTYAHDAHCNTIHEAGPQPCPPPRESGTTQISYAGSCGGKHEDPLPDVIWYRVDGHSNGRWLFVDHPDAHYGGIPVGIQRVYDKFLSSEEARAMAAALLQAADEWDVLKRKVENERAKFLGAVRHCEEELGGHQWPDIIKRPDDFICQRCGSAPRTVGPEG